MTEDDRKQEPADDEAADEASGDELESTMADDDADAPVAKDELESTQVDDEEAPADEVAAMRADAKAQFAAATKSDGDEGEDSEPQPVAAPETDPGSAAPPAPRPVWMTAIQWLLPVALSGAAVGVHWWLNVPEEIAVSKGDQGAKRKAKPKRRRAAGRRYDVRDARVLAREYKRWKRVDFEGEPVHGKWARAYQALISRAVVVARREAFSDAAAQARVNVVLAECRTVRCRFLLRTPNADELPVVDAALQRLEDNSGKVWRSYESKPVDPPEDMPADQTYYEVMVSWTSDEIDSRSFTIPPAPQGEGVGAAAASGGAGSGGAPADDAASGAQP